MAFDCVHFAPPTEIHVERVRRGEILLVQLQFPGVRRSRLQLPTIEYPRRRTCLNSCFRQPKIPSSFPNSTWTKLVDEKQSSSSFRSGVWIAVPSEKRPTNGEMWLRIFRQRISVMVISLQKERVSTQDGGKASNQAGLPVTRYYYWDSGRMTRTLNAQSSEFLIKDDHVYLRLASGGEAWTEEDAEDLRSMPQEEEAQGQSKGVKTVDAEQGATSGDAEMMEDPPLEVENRGCPDGDMISENNNSPDEAVLAEQTNAEVGVEKEEDGERGGKTQTAEGGGVGLQRRPSLDTNTHPLEEAEVVCADAPKTDVENTPPGQEAKGLEEAKQDQEVPKSLEKSTSCTDIREVVDVSTATVSGSGVERGCSASERCHYCLGVREQFGKAEFRALQARVEAMNREEWARVLDIILGKGGTKGGGMKNSPPHHRESGRKK